MTFHSDNPIVFTCSVVVHWLNQWSCDTGRKRGKIQTLCQEPRDRMLSTIACYWQFGLDKPIGRNGQWRISCYQTWYDILRRHCERMVQCVWIPHWRFKSSLDRLQRRRWEFWQCNPGVFLHQFVLPNRSEVGATRKIILGASPILQVAGYYLTLSSAAVIDCNGGKLHWLCMRREKCRATRFILSFQVCGGFTASCPWARGLRCFLLLARYVKVIVPLWICSMNSTAGIH